MSAPVPAPRQLVCLARSFGRHALELGNPVPTRPLFFLKSPRSIIAPGAPIVLPKESEEVHHEGEVAVWLGAPLYQASVAEAEAAIASWTVLNDVTARDIQRADGGRFTRAKSFPTFCPLATESLPALPHWGEARIQCWVNRSLRQDAPLSDMLFSPGEALAALSETMALGEGDLISLGTPAGVAALHHGDEVEVRLLDRAGQRLLSLSNPVVDPRS